MLRPTSARPGARPARPGRPGHRARVTRRPQVEPLEGRALLATITASFDFGGGITFAGVPIASYSWDVTKTQGTAIANGSDFQLELPENSADAALLAAVARGKSIPEVDLTDDYGGPQERLVFKMTNVLVEDFSPDQFNGSDPKATRVDLTSGKIEEDFAVAPAGGGPFTTRASTVWNLKTNVVRGRRSIPLPGDEDPARLAMSLTLAKMPGALPLDSIAQDAPVAGPGQQVKAAPFVVSSSTGPGAGVDPELLFNLVDDVTIAGVTLNVNATGSFEKTIRLSNVNISSLTTEDADGGQPNLRIGLAWGQLGETYLRSNADGSADVADPPVTMSWDATKNTVGGGLGGFPALADATAPLDLFTSATVGALPVESATLSAEAAPATSTHAGQTSPGPLIVTAAASTADPGLLAAFAKGTVIPDFELVVSPPVQPDPAFAYTLSHVTITSFATSLAADGTSTTTFSLTWEKLQEDYQTLNADGNLKDVESSWDVAKNTVEGGLSQLPTSDSPQLGLTVAGLDGEVTVTKASTSAFHEQPVSGRTSLAEPFPFQLTLAGSVADTGLIADLAGLGTLPELELHGLNASGNEYQTFKIGGAQIVSLETSFAAGGSFSTTIGLDWSKLEEDYRPTNPDGSVGAAVKMIWDRAGDSFDTGAPNLPTPASVPVIGLTIPGTAGDLPLDSIVAQPTPADGGIIGIRADGSIADPGFLGAMAKGTQFSEVDLHILDRAGGAEYATYRLTGVYITQYDTSLSPGGLPTSQYILKWSTLEEVRRPTNADGTLGPAATVSWDVGQNKVDGTPLRLPTPPSPPATGVTIPGLPGELTASGGFQFEAARPLGSDSLGNLGPISLFLDGSIADPGMLAALIRGTQFAEIDVHVRAAGAPPSEYLTYRLKGVRIADLTTSFDSDLTTPLTDLVLEPSSIEADYSPASPADPLGPAAVATWDTELGTAAVTVDETSSVRFTAGGFVFDRKTQHFVQTIRIKNTSHEAIAGSLVLDGLTNATLVGASGTSPVIGAPGSPFLVLPTIDLGQTITVTLEFIDPTREVISYTPRLLVKG